jgi:hypothetical protein
MAETPSPAGPETQHGDPREHAAELLDQADRLTRLANELQSEARRLNAALEDAAPRRERRFAPASERRDEGATSIEGEPDELPISDGARLMITNLATTGTSREEILDLMRNELGLEDAEAILDRLSI